MSISYTEAQLGSFFDLPAGEDLTSWFTHLCEDQAAAFPAPAPAFEAPAAMADPRKRSAEYQLAPEGEASGVKRQRSPTSSRENSGGSNDGELAIASDTASLPVVVRCCCLPNAALAPPPPSQSTST